MKIRPLRLDRITCLHNTVEQYDYICRTSERCLLKTFGTRSIFILYSIQNSKPSQTAKPLLYEVKSTNKKHLLLLYPRGKMNRQTMLFSATMPGDVQAMASLALRAEYKTVDSVGEEEDTHQHVPQK